MVDDIVQKTLKKIKKEKITPTTKWKFISMKVLAWISFGVLILLAAISFALLVHQLSQFDWDVYWSFRNHFVRFTFIVAPYFWLLIFLIFLVFSLVNLWKTKSGYKYKELKITGLVVLLVLSLGILFFSLKQGERLNLLLMHRVPRYDKFANIRERQWSQPENGFLGGEIISIDNNSNFDLKDFQGNSWVIIYTPNTKMIGDVNLRPEEKIKIIGMKMKEQEFSADEFRPWGPGPDRSRHMFPFWNLLPGIGISFPIGPPPHDGPPHDFCMGNQKNCDKALFDSNIK